MRTEQCFHCHEKIPKGVEIFAQINGEKQAMCCHGCKSVAEFIAEEGYCEFYDYRGDAQPASKAKVADKKWLPFDEEINLKKVAKAQENDLLSVSIRLEGMYCSACGWLIDKHLRQTQGIKQVKLNSMTKIVQVTFDLSQIKLSQILSAINHLGYQPQLNSEQDNENHELSERKSALKRLVVAGFGMMFIMTLSVPLYSAETGGIEPQMYRFFALMSMFVAT
ncbi:MAG TPA: heavy metal translocating P-type ATPase, partial [Oceanospirillales bacterium]|nr:heavy metal translocating P-type ATPase [Oceanospirillales bacterium]